MCGFFHKPAGFDHLMSLNRINDIRIIIAKLTKFTHNPAVFIIDSNALIHGFFCDGHMKVIFKFIFQNFKFCC